SGRGRCVRLRRRRRGHRAGGPRAGAARPARAHRRRGARLRRLRARRAAGPCRAPPHPPGSAGQSSAGAVDRRASRAARRAGLDRRRRALRLPRGPRPARAALDAPLAGRMALPSRRRTSQAVAPLPHGQPALRVAADRQPKPGGMVTETRLVILEHDGQARAARLHDLVARVTALGWFERATSRALLHVGSGGQSSLAAVTAQALAAALRERSPALRIEVLDLAGRSGQWNGLPTLAVDRDDTVVVRGPRGSTLRVPRLWFESFFLVTVAPVRPDRRWRIGGVLQAQAEILAHLNPGAST